MPKFDFFNLPKIIFGPGQLSRLPELAAPLGTAFPIPHGTICAALLPHVITANIDYLQLANPTLTRYATLGRILSTQNLPTTEALTAAITLTYQLLKDLQIPRLTPFGLTPSHIPAQVQLAQKSNSMR